MVMHPFFAFLFAALLTLAKGRSPFQRAVHLALPVLAFACLYPYLPHEGIRELHRLTLPVGSLSLQLLRIDTLSILFCGVFLIYMLLANLYAYAVKSRIHLIASYLYAGSSLGAVLAGDLLVLFIFWEIMALASAVLVWNPEREISLRAVFRYLLIHALGGLCFFAGLMLRMSEGQSLALAAQPLDTAGALFFAAFAVNAALPPVHAWLPDAYSASTPQGSVYLCAFTSKVAVFAFIRCFAGCDWLIGFGAAAAALGVLFAMMADDIRKLLSYHLICQVGFMLAGVGIGTDLGINGAAGHAVGNILFKGLLFMAAGTILSETGFSRLSELGGLASRNRGLLALYLVGAMAISGFPGLNGYVTKSLLFASAEKAHLQGLSVLFTWVSVGTFLSIGLKLTFFAFFAARPAGPLPNFRLSVPVTLAMSGCVFLCFLFGLDPAAFLYPYLPYPVNYNVFSAGHILGTLQLLAGTLTAFLFLKSSLLPKKVLTLDLDWIYRKGGLFIQRGLSMPLDQGQAGFQQNLSASLKHLNQQLQRMFSSVTPPGAGASLITLLWGLLGAAVWFFGVGR